MPVKRLINLDITTGSYSSVLDRLTAICTSSQRHYVCVANVHMLMEAYWNVGLRQVINGASIVTPDGMPLAKGLQLLYREQQDRVSGMDLLPDLFLKAEEKNLKVCLVGGNPLVYEALRNYLQEKHSSLIITGMYDCVVEKDGSCSNIETLVSDINAGKPDIVLVSLGCPKQELFMGNMKDLINGCMIGIGGALPVMVGLQKRAPLWMQRNSLEWFYRLLLEPRRLARRYFKTNIPFLFLLMLQLCKRKKQISYFDIYYLFD